MYLYINNQYILLYFFPGGLLFFFHKYKIKEKKLIVQFIYSCRLVKSKEVNLVCLNLGVLLCFLISIVIDMGAFLLYRFSRPF
jgi:hypothetical protein